MLSLRLSPPRPFGLLAAVVIALCTLAFSRSAIAEVTPRPDLIISALTLDPGSARTGTSVSAVVAIRNAGGAPADLSAVRLYFEPGGGAPSTSLGSASVDPLAPGESRTLTLPFTVPTVAPGHYYLVWVQADPDASLAETNDGNNRRGAWLAVTLPDVTITGLTLPRAVRANDPATASIVVRNGGRVPADLSTVGLYLEPGGGAPTIALGAAPIEPLAPGQSRTIALSFTVPAVAPGRSYLVWAKADPDATLAETNNSNNRRDGWLAVTLPDLTVTGLSLPRAVRAGDPATASLVVRNGGWVLADSSTVRLYLDPGGGAPTIALGAASIDPLAAGESRTLSLSFTVPAVTPGRSYRVWAKADPDASLTETNDGNNRRDAWLPVTLPDLTIANLTLPSAARANDTVTASVVVRNGGLVPADASTVGLYFEPGGDAPTVSLGSAPVGGLGAGQSRAIALSFAVPAVAPGRSYRVWAKADPDATLAETNDGNNRRDVWLAVTLPDLTITGLSLPPAARAGDRVKATLRVRNQGWVLANATRTRLFVTTSSTASLDGLVPVATMDVPALPPGKETLLTQTVPLPMLAPGAYQLVAVADGGAAQAETNETNNRRAAAFDIAKPTITIDALGLSPSLVQGGQMVTTSVRIANHGRVPTYPTAADVFLATQESSDLGGGISAMRLTVPEIPPGGTAPLSVSLPAPADHPGVYYVIAQLDSAQATSVTAALVASAAAAPVSSPGSRKSAKLQVAAAPDLRVTSLTATPSSARAGATVVAKGTIRNQASVLSGSTTLRLWLTANSSLSPLAAGAAAVDLGSSPVAGIPAGSQVSFAVSVTLPAGTQPGVWYLQAMADAGSALPESDETNNLASTALTVQPDESASGPVYYVATYGNDGNPGTESQPFRTVARGAQALTPGATLYVRSGTYAESLMNVIPGGTSWTAPVRVVAYSGETVVLRPNAGATRVLHFQGPRTAFISVEGFVLDGANVGYDAVKITYGSVPSDAAHHIRLLNCEIKNAPLQGVLVSSGADSNEFINLDVHHNGTTDFHHGFYVASQRNLIEGSTIHANSGTGIQLYYSDGVSVHDNVVRGNWVVSNASAGARGAGVSVSRGARNRIYNNVIVGNVVGIFVDYSVTDTDVYNNTLYANEDYGLYVGTGSVGADIRNNIVYASTGPNYANAGSGTAQSNNLFGVDPRFMDPTRSDYHLRADSPAVDAGMTLNLVTTDLDGVSRPQHNLSDIGAFELR